MEIIPEAFSPLYPWAFIIVINSLDSPDNMLANNALYPWGTSVGKDKHGLSIGLSIGSARFKHERNAIMQHQPVFKLHPVRLPVEPPLARLRIIVHVYLWHIRFAHVHSQIVAVASIRGRRLFCSAPQIVRRLFEGGVYSRAASIRGNTVCQTICDVTSSIELANIG